jgi:hypothetical protein
MGLKGYRIDAFWNPYITKASGKWLFMVNGFLLNNILKINPKQTRPLRVYEAKWRHAKRFPANFYRRLPWEQKDLIK